VVAAVGCDVSELRKAERRRNRDARLAVVETPVAELPREGGTPAADRTVAGKEGADVILAGSQLRDRPEA
jgi:hypothetical protein